MKITRQIILDLGFTTFIDANTSANQYRKGEIEIYCNHDMSDVVLCRDGRNMARVYSVGELKLGIKIMERK